MDTVEASGDSGASSGGARDVAMAENGAGGARTSGARDEEMAPAAEDGPPAKKARRGKKTRGGKQHSERDAAARGSTENSKSAA